MHLGLVPKPQRWLANWTIAYLHCDGYIPESSTSDILDISKNVSGYTPQSGSSSTQVTISQQDPHPTQEGSGSLPSDLESLDHQVLQLDSQPPLPPPPTHTDTHTPSEETLFSSA